MRLSVAILGVLTAATIMAQEDDLRAKLIGAWQQSESAGDPSVMWVFREAEGAMHVIRYEGDRAAAEFECNTMGKECSVKDSGKSAKVTMYYNGPKLVQMETKGIEIVKRRFGVAGGGELMEMELFHLVPEGKTETLHFKRVDERKH